LRPRVFGIAPLFLLLGVFLVTTMVSAKILVLLFTFQSAHSQTAAHFPYEPDHLIAENIDHVLSECLPKRSRIQGSNVVDYLSQFLFAPIYVMNDHNAAVDYHLPGPDNCKNFPGDPVWP
jgi:hypothetical protein